MPHDDFAAVLQIKARDEFEKEIVRFGAKLGFKTASAMVVVDHFGRDSDFLFFNSAPAEAFEPNDREYGRIDPVMQHCKHGSVPIIWNQDTYTDAGLGWRWETQARFGLHTGIALALHLPQGRHFFFSVDRDQPLPKDSCELLNKHHAVVKALQLGLVH